MSLLHFIRACETLSRLETVARLLPPWHDEKLTAVARRAPPAGGLHGRGKFGVEMLRIEVARQHRK